MGLDIFGGGEATAALFNTAGSFVNSMMSYNNAKKLMDRQNEFTERMSNTAYSRATADMRNAGLNPALMYGSGSAASTPTAGSGATGPQFDIGNPMNAAMEYKNAKATVANTEASAAYNRELAESEQNRRDNLDADTAFKKAENIRQDKHLDNETRKVAGELQELISRSELNKEIAKYTGMNSVSSRIQANAASRSAEGNYYYNTHRALGFSESESVSDTERGYNGSFNIGSRGDKKSRSYGGSLGRTGGSHSRSYSRTY